jgi:formiminoglutamase
MSGALSKPVDWWSLLEPTSAAILFRRDDADDQRLGDVVERWAGGPPALRAGQPVLVGFPCDEGVRRNHGRAGAAQAPAAIRAELYRLTGWDGPAQTDLAKLNLLDIGNVRVDAELATSQQRLGTVVHAIMQAGAVPMILGGGHETTYGHYLGYVEAQMECAILNVDAHLDVRTFSGGGHSGSPFRQAMEHASQPLQDGSYAVLGAQRQCVARAHEEYVRHHGGRIYWWDRTRTIEQAAQWFMDELERCKSSKLPLIVTVDADAFCQADVPGVSAPNPFGMDGALWPALAFQAGVASCVRSLDVVEVNLPFDRDNQTSRWAAIGLRMFLVGLAFRGEHG